MIKIAVVDDEKIMLDKICKIIDENFTEDKTIRSFESSMDFFNDADKYSFDIVFLDIDMPEIDGFQLAEDLKLINSNIAIIFVSNMDHLVFDSFRFNPFRFVRKEFLSVDLTASLYDYYEIYKNNLEFYFIKTSEFECNILLSDIIYFESMGHDVYVKCKKGKFKIKRESKNAQTIKYLSLDYECKGFIRIHKSFLVNFRYIYNIDHDEIVLKNNEHLPINRKNYSEIQKKYHQHLMGGKYEPNH